MHGNTFQVKLVNNISFDLSGAHTSLTFECHSTCSFWHSSWPFWLTFKLNLLRDIQFDLFEEPSSWPFWWIFSLAYLRGIQSDLFEGHSTWPFWTTFNSTFLRDIQLDLFDDTQLDLFDFSWTFSLTFLREIQLNLLAILSRYGNISYLFQVPFGVGACCPHTKRVLCHLSQVELCSNNGMFCHWLRFYLGARTFCHLSQLKIWS